MFTKIKEFLFGKPVQVEAPYKVEAPVKTVELTSVEDGTTKLPVQCGCGRSPTGYCVGLHALSADEWSTHADNKNSVVVGKSADDRVEATAPAKPKAPVKKQQFEKKAVVAKPPAAAKAPPKPRAPRKPVAK